MLYFERFVRSGIFRVTTSLKTLTSCKCAKCKECISQSNLFFIVTRDRILAYKNKTIKQY